MFADKVRMVPGGCGYGNHYRIMFCLRHGTTFPELAEGAMSLALNSITKKTEGMFLH